MAFGNVGTASSNGNDSALSKQLQSVQGGSLAHENTDERSAALNQNRFSDHNRHKKKKKTSKKQTALQSSIKLRLATTDARTLPFEEWVHNLRGPAKWCSERELRAFYEFGYGSSSVTSFIKKRLMKAILIGLVMTVISFIGLPKVVHGLVGPKAIMAAIVIGVLAMFLIWAMGVRSSLRAYQNMLYQRQLVFIKFERLLIPYLSEMKNGVSLFSMLKKVCARLTDEGDRKLVQRLMGNIAEGANTSAPFVDFARRFGGSDSARLFMLSIYQMYSGNYNDAVVKDLGEQSNEQMMQQVTKIANKKLKRFNHLTTWLTMGSALVIIGYMASIIADSFSKAVKLMNQNSF